MNSAGDFCFIRTILRHQHFNLTQALGRWIRRRGVEERTIHMISLSRVSFWIFTPNKNKLVEEHGGQYDFAEKKCLPSHLWHYCLILLLWLVFPHTTDRVHHSNAEFLLETSKQSDCGWKDIRLFLESPVCNFFRTYIWTFKSGLESLQG